MVDGGILQNPNMESRIYDMKPIRDSRYQPSKKELLEPVKIDATPSQVAKAVLSPMRKTEKRTS